MVDKRAQTAPRAEWQPGMGGAQRTPGPYREHRRRSINQHELTSAPASSMHATPNPAADADLDLAGYGLARAGGWRTSILRCSSFARLDSTRSIRLNRPRLAGKGMTIGQSDLRRARWKGSRFPNRDACMHRRRLCLNGLLQSRGLSAP